MNSDNKSAIRNEMTLLRNRIEDGKRREWSRQACLHAARWLEQNDISAFMAYLAFRSELDLTELIEWGWRTGRQIIVPRCELSDRSMTLYTIESWSQLETGAYGILEPAKELAQPADCHELGAVFVPGIAFDRSGGRLGYGGGYYDRFAEASSRMGRSTKLGARWIGAAYNQQLIHAVPLEEHDVRMDGLLTEEGLHWFNIEDIDS